MGERYRKASPSDVTGSKVAEEVIRNHGKEGRNGIAGAEHRINERAVLEHASVFEKQFSATAVQWERFLPFRTLRVLLVENDDSTRQLVRALLRNCCYEVTAVANGLEAWKILEDITTHIDVVLTEVILPCLSGIGLLCKIVSHKTCKNVPVIMMSSNDSMGIVFKCLSKGAVDFLVKPIRKNELKNLWQHVWRRCHSCSGSGSESGIQGNIFIKSKSEDSSNNNNEEDESIDLNARDESESGSGTQSLWTKHVVEVDSPQTLPPPDQIASQNDSTCVQAIHPCTELFSNQKASVNGGIDLPKQRNHADFVADDFAGKDSNVAASLRNINPRNEPCQTDQVLSEEKLPKIGLGNIDSTWLADDKGFLESIAQVPEQVNRSFPGQVSALSPDTLKAFPSIPENNELTSFELSLKRLRSTVEDVDERTILKHSNISAFSRYPALVSSVQASVGYGGSYAFDNSSAAAPTNIGSDGKNNNNGMVSDGGNNNNDKSSTSINLGVKPGAYASAFHPVRSRGSAIQPTIQDRNEESTEAPENGSSGGLQKHLQVQHHHHHYHHHHHHVHSLPTQPDQDVVNSSFNGSNSGSNRGSDGQNGCNLAINAGEARVESVITGAERGAVGASNVTGNAPDHNRFAQREAALSKFRQKRKERNFGKKVRYQSRKKLAEQRPRVRGQFVRRIDQ